MPGERRIIETLCVLLLISGCGGDGANAPTVSETVLHSFGATSTDGLIPGSSPIQAKDGNLYGLTTEGGTNGTNTGTYYNSGDGTFYRITPEGVETVLYSFGASSTDGLGPTGLIQGADGNFYVTTAGGGVHNAGTIIKINPAGVETVLYSFGASSTDARGPSCLIQATDGNFYGIASGGVGGYGAVFMVTPTGVETVFYSFDASAAAPPEDVPGVGLLQGADGNFYGTLTSGGALGQGAVFRITPAGEENVIYSFGTSSADGYDPGGLIEDSAGNFYVSTQNGGSTLAGGTISKVTPAGVETVLHTFTPSVDGSGPSGLILGADGNFYGSAGAPGPTGGGTVFMMTPTGAVTLLYSFGNDTSIDGSSPSGVIQDPDGNLYGATSGGGAYDIPGTTSTAGTVFKITL